MTETKSVEANGKSGNETNPLDIQYSKYLINGEHVIRVALAKRSYSKRSTSLISNPVNTIRAFKTTLDAVKDESMGRPPMYPGSGEPKVLDRRADMVITNYRIFLLNHKSGEPLTAYHSISIVYNPAAKPILVEVNKERHEERDELATEAKAGDKAAKKELKRQEGRSLRRELTGVASHGERREHQANALKYPEGWYEPVNVTVKGSNIEFELNWNNPQYMMLHLGATTPEAMRSTMGAQFYALKPLEVTFKKLKKQDAQDIYALIRRAT